MTSAGGIRVALLLTLLLLLLLLAAWLVYPRVETSVRASVGYERYDSLATRLMAAADDVASSMRQVGGMHMYAVHVHEAGGRHAYVCSACA